MIESDVSRRREPGFTLIELLVVMAITVILLGLIFGPMVQGFNLTNRARVQVLTQDSARRVMEIGQRDVSNGVFVFDNTGQPINFWVTGRQNPNDPNSAPVVVPVQIPYACVDLVPPARYVDQDASVQPGDLDPTTGLPIETPAALDPRFNVALPVAPGRVIIRYFTGLRDNTSDTDPSGLTSGRPRKPYGNFYDDPRNMGLSDHNPFLLYRAVVSPYTPAGRVDTRLFHISSSGSPILYDPNFFYDVSDAAVPNDPAITSAAVPGWKDLNGDGSVQIFENWKAVSRALVPVDRADEVTVERDDNRRVVYIPYSIGNATYGVPKLTPLVKFQPTYVGNDAGAPTSTTDTGNEVGVNIPPSTQRENYGHWTTPYNIYIYRGDMGDTTLRYFVWNGAGPVMYVGPETGGSPVSTGFDPYTLDTRRLTAPQKPSLDLQSVSGQPQALFTVDERRGLINFTFPEWIVRHDSQGNPLSAQSEPQVCRYDPAAVNQKYNTATGSRYRYLNAYVYPNGNLSPLFDINKIWTYDRSGNKVLGMRIVPGSEVVTGPDMRPGPNYGKSITYTRVPALTDAKSIGPNEYVINYEDRPGPAPGVVLTPEEQDILRAGAVIFDSQGNDQHPLDTPAPHVLPTTDNDGNPAAPVTVTYEVQNNLFTDVVKADYLTRQLMTFSLGVRLYDFNSGQPQQVTLTQKINVRNLQR